jgi:hypothetical protein
MPVWVWRLGLTGPQHEVRQKSNQNYPRTTLPRVVDVQCTHLPHDHLRSLLAERHVEAVIPSIARRKPLIPHDRDAYRQRNLIERMFARLEDFHRIATRYDKLARNFLAGVLIAATLLWWLN